MELEELKNIGNSIGFFKVEELNIDKIKLLPEVRQMCSRIFQKNPFIKYFVRFHFRNHFC